MLDETNDSQIFVGRKKELKELESIYKTRSPWLIVIKGRRRVGKSKLVAEFAKDKPFWKFKAEPPKPHETKQDKLNEFRERIQSYVEEKVPFFESWFWALEYLNKVLKPGTVLLFDEISWMSHGDDSLVGKLKNFWDDIDHAGRHIMFFICGSVSTWIEKNITWGTALHGRVGWNFSLQPLSIPESMQILRHKGFSRSPRECIKLLSFFGGIPYYLQRIKADESAATAIKRMCFTPDGLLVNEFDIIFHDLFNGERGLYKEIMYVLSAGIKSLSEIRTALKYTKEQEDKAPLASLLENLCVSGFVIRHYQWNPEAVKYREAEDLFRIFDPYSRFYLKIIEAHKREILEGQFEETNPTSLPGMDGIVGLQVEHLLIQNRWLMLRALNIEFDDFKYAGPYRQFPSKNLAGVQVDYLIHTKESSIFVCEFKFSREKIGIGIIAEVQAKLDKIKLPVGGGFVPVLIHAGGVTPEVENSRFFGKIIEITQLLDIEI